MGCGMSTLKMDDASPSRRSNRVHHHAMAPPPVNKGDEGVTPSLQKNNKGAAVVMKPLGDEEAKTKENASNDERPKEKGVVERNNNKEEERVFHGDDEKHAKIIGKTNEEKNEDRDIDSYMIGPGSPSFREYCTEYDSRNPSSIRDSNDCDSRESIKNGGDDDSTSMKNKPKSEGSVNSNKEHEKKERRGRGFRNVMNRGKGRGKRNLLNFACYNASTESFAENSLNKIVEKAV